MKDENAVISSVTVRNTLPAEIVAISPEAIVEVNALVKSASVLKVVDATSLEQANELYRCIDRLAKEIAGNRLDITRPIDSLKKAIISAEEQATSPLLEAKKDLGLRMVRCQNELRKAREEAERVAREEAEKKAAEERARLEAERQVVIAKQKADQEAAEAKAREEAELLGIEAEPVVAPQPPPPVVVVPIVIEPTVPEAPKAAVRVSTRQKVEECDASLLPIVVAGVIVRVPDLKAIEKLLKAGIQVPGYRLTSVEGIGLAGGRK